MHTCTLCKQEKPPEAFHKSSRNLRGLKPWCKPCTSALGKREREKNPKPRVRYYRPKEGDSATEAPCSQCKRTLPIDMFGFYEGRLKSRCRECLSAKATLKWRKERQDNPKKQWVVTSVWRTRTRAKSRNIPHSLTVADLEAITATDKCFYCDREVLFHAQSGGDNIRQAATVDNVVIALGYVANNIVLSCYRCNAIKNDATAEELENISKRVLAFRSANQK